MSNETPQQPTPANELLEALGTTLSPDLLVQALTHRSFSHEHPGVANYERLEFLGDAVLELVSTETLFTIHPDMTEGQLAKMRAKAVSEDALSAIAKTKLKVGPYILLGHGEAEQGGAEKNSILCDIVESLIGATFLEHGIDEARKVIHRLIDDIWRSPARNTRRSSPRASHWARTATSSASVRAPASVRRSWRPPKRAGSHWTRSRRGLSKPAVGFANRLIPT